MNNGWKGIGKTHQQYQESHPKENWLAAQDLVPRHLCLCLVRLFQRAYWLFPLTGQSDRCKQKHLGMQIGIMGHMVEQREAAISGTFRIRWFSVSATYTASPLMATPWGELKEAPDMSPSFLPLSGPEVEVNSQIILQTQYLFTQMLLRLWF